MILVWTIRADCDDPPNDDYMQLHGMELDEDLQNAVAGFLMDAGSGSYSVDIAARVEV